jgi:hypothetical protein
LTSPDNVTPYKFYSSSSFVVDFPTTQQTEDDDDHEHDQEIPAS